MQALRASAAQWKAKCADLQAAALALTRDDREKTYTEAFGEHAEARRKALEEEVQRLRTRLKTTCTEIEELRPLASTAAAASLKAQTLEDELAQLRATLTETKREKTEAATALSKLQHERDVHAWTASSEMEQAVMAAETRAREAVAEQERLQHTVTDTERAAEGWRTNSTGGKWASSGESTRNSFRKNAACS